MTLEGITKEEFLIREAFSKWSNEISDKYIGNHQIAMDAKMYLSLNKLYLKNKNRYSH